MNQKMEELLETLQRDQKLANEAIPGFHVKDYDIHVYSTGTKDVPVIYVNSVEGVDYEVWQQALQEKLPDFVMMSVTHLNWDTDMAPWYCEPCGPGDTACYPGAEAYLKVLIEEIMPKAEAMLGFEVKHRWIAGYSLAGLFSVYSMYHTSLFERVISGSGSFWFPHFEEYVQKHTMERKPLSMYFSLGNEESHTEYPIFNTVQVRTEWLVEYYRKQGILDTFVLEPGNHYTDVAGRMVRGIKWTLDLMNKETSY